MNMQARHHLTAATPAQEQAAEIRACLIFIARGICPFCRCGIEKQRRIEQSVYAVPCWHRLYSGTLPTIENREV